MPEFVICYTITEQGRIELEAATLAEAKAKVDEMRFDRLRQDGDVDFDEINITDGWESE